MSEQTVTQPVPRSSNRRLWFRVGAVVVISLVAGLVTYLILRDRGDSKTPSNVSAATAAEIANLATQLGHPIYWMGPSPGFTYELTRQPNGTVVVRYLPEGAKLGSDTPFLTVATYPFKNAYDAVRKVAREPGVGSFRVEGGGLAEVKSSYPQSVHVAYPNVDYQAEIYDPSPGSAVALARTGKLVAAGAAATPKPTTAAPTAVAASLAELEQLPASTGHPVYWVGPRDGLSYELQRSTNGNVVIRYLPAGVAPGSKDPHLTVATYPYKNALAAIQALGKKSNVDLVKLPGGGLAAIDKSYPASVHLAYPRSDVQVEVYSPSPGAARKLVAAGDVSALG